MRARFTQADHHGGNDIVVTPRYVVDAVGPFDLDPCYSLPRPWPTAATMYAPEDGEDGMELPWNGRVWLNQPYSEAERWAEKMAQHSDGIMLVFARTETRWFQRHVFPRATGLLFLEGRLNFCQSSGEPIRTKSGTVSNAGAPSVLVSYDRTPGIAFNMMKLALALRDEKLRGHLVRLWGLR